jgi:hypothetical protein
MFTGQVVDLKSEGVYSPSLFFFLMNKHAIRPPFIHQITGKRFYLGKRQT